MSPDWLGWPMLAITAVDAPFAVLSPPELADQVRSLAARLTSST